MRTIVKECEWRTRSRRKSRTRPPVRAMRSRNAKTPTKWRKRTARLRISVGEDYGDGDNGKVKAAGEKSKLPQSQVAPRADEEHGDRRAHRCRPNGPARKVT